MNMYIPQDGNDPDKNSSARAGKEPGSEPIAILEPACTTEETRFERAFFTSLDHRIRNGTVINIDGQERTENNIMTTRPQGLMIEFLYWMADDPHKAWGNPNPPTKPPWDTLVGTAGNSYSAFGSEPSALSFALREGLARNLPDSFCYYAYGPGEAKAVEDKDFAVIRSGLSAGKKIVGVATFDMVDSYARGAATEIHKAFNLKAQAYKVNLIANGASAIRRSKEILGTKASSVIGIFGGLLQNIPDEEAIQQYKKIREQHGEDVHLIMPVNASTDPRTMTDQYKWTQELEGFILNFLPRAKVNGTITTPDFDVFAHWKLAGATYDTVHNAVEIFAEAKDDHILHTDFRRISEGERSVEIKKGDKISVTFSRKGPVEDHVKNLKKAGFPHVEWFVQPGDMLPVIHAGPKPPEPETPQP